MPQLKITQLIHASFCLAVFVFAIVALFVNKDVLLFEMPKKWDDFLFPALSVLSTILGTTIFNVLLGNIDQTSNTSSKLMQYQTAFLVKCAFLEAGALANIVAFLIDGNLFFLIFAGLSFARLVASRPTASRVADDLSLQDSDIL